MSSSATAGELSLSKKSEFAREAGFFYHFFATGFPEGIFNLLTGVFSGAELLLCVVHAVSGRRVCVLQGVLYA